MTSGIANAEVRDEVEAEVETEVEAEVRAEVEVESCGLSSKFDGPQAFV